MRCNTPSVNCTLRSVRHLTIRADRTDRKTFSPSTITKWFVFQFSLMKSIIPPINCTLRRAKELTLRTDRTDRSTYYPLHYHQTMNLFLSLPMRCNIPFANCTPRIARTLNHPYRWNELNILFTDRYNAGVLDNPHQTGTQLGQWTVPKVKFKLGVSRTLKTTLSEITFPLTVMSVQYDLVHLTNKWPRMSILSVGSEIRRLVSGGSRPWAKRGRGGMFCFASSVRSAPPPPPRFATAHMNSHAARELITNLLLWWGFFIQSFER